jgi:hypothetical protein
LNLVHHSFAQALIAARLDDAEQRRMGHRMVRAERMSRKAARAAVRARQVSRMAMQAERRARVAHARVT